MTEGKSDKGASLEVQTAMYFQAHGFVVRRGVVLATESGAAEATDIDVLGIRFSLPLCEERLLADCKSRRTPKAFERVLWTRGLAAFADAGRALVVTSRAPWQARQFAARGGVEVLDTEGIGSFLATAGQRPFGDADPKLARRLMDAKRLLKGRDQTLQRSGVAVRQMLVQGHPLTNLNRVIRVLPSLSGADKAEGQDDAGRWTARYLAFDAAVVATIMLVRFAAECKWTSEADWSDYARKRLTYGDLQPSKAREIAKLALDREFHGGLPAPEYTDEILQVVGMLISKPELAAWVPYAMDFHLFGRVLGAVDESYVHPVLGRMQNDTMGAVKRILSALAFAAGIPHTVWSASASSVGARKAPAAGGCGTDGTQTCNRDGGCSTHSLETTG